MAIFKNFIIVVILVGLMTRLANHYYLKKMKRTPAAYLSFFSVGVIVLPIVSFAVGFDVTISEYVGALLMWLLFDLLRAGAVIEKP